MWDLDSLTKLHTLTGHKDAVRALKLANGRLFSGSYDGTLRCWDAATFRCEATLERHTGPVRTLTSHENLIFSGKGRVQPGAARLLCACLIDSKALHFRCSLHPFGVRSHLALSLIHI